MSLCDRCGCPAVRVGRSSRCSRCGALVADTAAAAPARGAVWSDNVRSAPKQSSRADSRGGTAQRGRLVLL